MSLSKTVLVTGSAGTLGQAVVKALAAGGHVVRGFDVRPSPGVAEQIVASAADGGVLEAAAVGCDCVIHLAATPDDAVFPRGDPPDDGDNFLAELVPNNIIAGYRVLEATRKAKVPRLVFASSGQMVWLQTFDGPLPAKSDSVPTPRYLYCATKAFLESAGFSYSHYHQIAVVAVRLGWCPRPGQVAEIAASERAQDVYLSPNDAGQFFLRTVEADYAGFHIVYATSIPRRICRLDLSIAKSVFGFEPREMWPQGVE